jgi:hypothetical protein
MRGEGIAGAGPGGAWRVLLAVTALVSAAGEIAGALFVAPAAALLFAAMFLVGWFLLRRGDVVGPLLIGLFSILEIVFIPAYAHADRVDWTVQAAFGVLGVVGAAAAAATLRAERRVRAAGRRFQSA